MLNKKASWIHEAAPKLILAIIGGIILYSVFIYGFLPFISGSGSKEACKNWANLQSTPILKDINTFESSCITTQETIKKAKEKKEVYKILADNMYDCWDMYGRGEADFYKSFDFGKADKYCRICSEIKIDPDLKESLREVDIDEFEKYLNNEKIPRHRETYSEFFLKTQNAQIDFGSGTLKLDPEKGVYTSFVVYKKSTPPNFWKLNSLPTVKELGFGAGGCIIGAKLGGIAGGAAGLIAGGLPAPLFAPAGAIGGCAIGFLGGSLVAVIGYSNYLFPSITIFEADPNQIQNACDYVYYKPQK